jgi:hypothetical protein
VIKVGAATEVEMKEKKARVEDALHATRAAVEEGVVPGGGVALIRALTAIGELKGANEDQNHGIAIALRAMEAPLRRHSKAALAVSSYASSICGPTPTYSMRRRAARPARRRCMMGRPAAGVPAESTVAVGCAAAAAVQGRATHQRRPANLFRCAWLSSRAWSNSR